MLQEILRLESQGMWSEIRTRQAELLAGVADSDRARAHIAIQRAYFWTATTGADWRESLRHARSALDLAPAGSYLQVLALQKVTSLLVDMGRLAEAKPFAAAFMKLVSAHPEAAKLAPYVKRAQGEIELYERRLLEAARTEHKAMLMFEMVGNSAEALRSRNIIACRYAKAGRPDQARAILTDDIPDYLQAGAMAHILAAEGNWQGAHEAGLEALQGARLVQDYADAAEICLIVAQAARRLGLSSDSTAYIAKAASFAARQDYDVLTLLVLSRGQGGGVTLHVHAAAALGSGGMHLDAAYTTGIA